MTHQIRRRMAFAIGLSHPRIALAIARSIIFTFCVSCRRRKMYRGHARLCVCLYVCASVCPRPYAHTTACTDPDVTWGRGRGCPLVVHYWADLQSGHGLRCYGNIKERKGCAILVRTHNANFSYKLASIPRYHDSANGRLGGVCARCWPVTGE